MSEPVTVRAARATDAQAIATFNAAMALETEGKRLDPATVLAGVRGLMAQPQLGFYLVAEVGGETVGSLLITYEWSDWRNGLFWWIQSVYVEPRRRGGGVFTRMYEHVFQQAQAAGNVCGLRLYVEANNATARRTYERLGMTTTEYRLLERELRCEERPPE